MESEGEAPAPNLNPGEACTLRSRNPGNSSGELRCEWLLKLNYRDVEDLVWLVGVVPRTESTGSDPFELKGSDSGGSR